MLISCCAFSGVSVMSCEDDFGAIATGALFSESSVLLITNQDTPAAAKEQTTKIPIIMAFNLGLFFC